MGIISTRTVRQAALAGVLGFFFIAAAHAEDSRLTKYEKVVEFLKKLETSYSANAKTFVLGDSDSGQKVLGLKLGNGPTQHVVVATHHGNEYGSTEVAKAFAESLAKQPIAGQTVYVIPVLNITGYNAGIREEVVGTRTYDPNRDYPGPCVSGPSYRTKATKALADFMAAENIVASATLHTFRPAVVYPWGISTHDTDTPYDNIFIGLAQAATAYSKYQIGNNTEVMYPADGTFEDYAYWKHGTWSLLFEMGSTHSPSTTAVQDLVAGNVPGLRRFLEEAPTTRAADHAFHGQCDTRMRGRDRHDD